MVDSTPFLSIMNVSKTYPGSTRPSVADATLGLEKGQMLALLGPSGCGKTSLLRIIAGLVAADGGDIRIDGASMRDVPLHRRGMGMVFQSYALFPHLSVARNIAFGLEVRKIGRAERLRRVDEMLSLTQLDGYADRKVSDLSGGQQQRVALARSLAIQPSVLLLDEPLANLDVKLRETMRAEIRSIQSRLGLTTLFVTHDQAEALTSADRVAVMNEGRILQIGTPQDIYDRPTSRFVAEFVGRSNFLALTAEDGRWALKGYGLLAGGPPPRHVRAGTHSGLLRPHRIAVRPQGAGPSAHDVEIGGIVREAIFGGDLTTVHIDAGDVRLTAEMPGGGLAAYVRGDPVTLGWNWRDVSLLENDA